MTLAPSLTEEVFAAALQDFPRPFQNAEDLGMAMRRLLAEGLTELPLPGGGATWERWRALAAVAAIDLSLAKVYEGHTDALAILAELKGKTSDGLWAVWAAEPPDARVIFRVREHAGILSGRKPWCSGAAVMDYAVVSAWTEGGEPILAQVVASAGRSAGNRRMESGRDVGFRKRVGNFQRSRRGSGRWGG